MRPNGGSVAKHKLKQKKHKAGKQWWADLCVEAIDRQNMVRGRLGKELYVPVSHHAEDRHGSCGRCGHPWAWHDNVWVRVEPNTATYNVIDTRIRCGGGYPIGLTVASCNCREVYRGG